MISPDSAAPQRHLLCSSGLFKIVSPCHEQNMYQNRRLVATPATGVKTAAVTLSRAQQLSPPSETVESTSDSFSVIVIIVTIIINSTSSIVIITITVTIVSRRQRLLQKQLLQQQLLAQQKNHLGQLYPRLLLLHYYYYYYYLCYYYHYNYCEIWARRTRSLDAMIPDLGRHLCSGGDISGQRSQHGHANAQIIS